MKAIILAALLTLALPAHAQDKASLTLSDKAFLLEQKIAQRLTRRPLVIKMSRGDTLKIADASGKPALFEPLSDFGAGNLPFLQSGETLSAESYNTVVARVNILKKELKELSDLHNQDRCDIDELERKMQGVQHQITVLHSSKADKQ